jgi:hypothetical protein
MKCRQVHDRLSDLLDERLPLREAQAVRRHIAECRPCAERWESLRASVAALRRLPRLKPAGSVALQVLSRLEVESRGPGLALLFRPAWMARPLIFPSLAPAALVLVSIMAGALALDHEPRTGVGMPAAAVEPRVAPSGTEANPLFPSADVGVPRMTDRREIETTILAADLPESSFFFETVVARDGSVSDVTLIEGEPSRAAAIVDALRRERFEPVRLRGRPVAVSVYRLISHTEVLASVT